jgi:hypothetical protein
MRGAGGSPASRASVTNVDMDLSGSGRGSAQQPVRPWTNVGRRADGCVA